MKFSKNAINNVAIIIGIIIVLVLCFLVVFAVQDKTRDAGHKVGNDCFIFSNGWELVSHGTYGMYTPQGITYICRNVETGQYAECTPIYEECR